LIVGLTGAYCAGKNRVAGILESRGLPSLDVDKLGHACLENQREAVFAHFGDGVKNPDGSVNRKALGAIAFASRDALFALEKIVHPEANRMTLEWIKGRKGRPCVVNAALLHKSAVFGKLGCVILVRAPLVARLARARRRDRLPWLDILKRFASQRRFAAQYSAETADTYSIWNPGIGMPAFSRGSARGKAGSDRRLERRIDEILAALKLEDKKV